MSRDQSRFTEALPLVIFTLLLAGCAAPQQAVVPAGEPASTVVVVDLDAPDDFTAEEAVLAEDDAGEEAFEELGVDACPCHGDLWDRIRDGFALPESDHARVLAARDWYQRHQAYLDRVANRARPYLHHIVEEVEARGMPLEIALLPIVESAFDPYAYSHGRASGLWQFIPATGRRFGLEQNWWYDGRRDVIESTRAALDYLEYLHGLFDDWLLALAAYNAGEGNVSRAIRRAEAAGRPADFFSLALPQETRGYAPKLLAIRDLVADPEAHGVSFLPIANEAWLGIAEFEGQLDLALAAELAEMPLDELYLLNPAHNRWATNPVGPHRLVLPLERLDGFMERLAEVPPEQRVSWMQHRVRSGETLSVLARRYRTTVPELQRANQLNGTMIRIGQDLLVPSSARPDGEYALTTGNRTAATQAVDRGGQRLEYTVRRGDSLWRIGREHGIAVRSLASWNAMAPNDTLREGQTLVIWLPTRAGQAQVAMGAGPNPAHTTRSITYTVRRGDSLARISQRFRVSVNDLVRWNELDPARYLQPGQRLRLYVDVTAQTGG